MLATRAPHAVLLAGPPSVGKRSLALDLAAGLLCTGAAGGDRPCRACRACRMVEHGNHPDLHVLAARVPAARSGSAGKDGKPGVRDLVTSWRCCPSRAAARGASSATPSG